MSEEKRNIEHIDVLEGSLEYQGEELTLDQEKQLIKKITRREDKYKGTFDAIAKEATANRKFYAGDQINLEDLYEHEDPVIVNKILQDAETVIPIVTRQTPEPNLTIKPKKLDNQKFALKLGRHLKDTWHIHDAMPAKMVKAMRNLMGTKFVAFKYFWDDENKQFSSSFIPTGNLIFPDKVAEYKDLPFIIEKVTTTLQDIKDRFPEKYEQVKKLVPNEDYGMDTDITYTEYWEDDFVAYKYQDILLGYERNPHYNYDNDVADVADESLEDDKGTEMEESKLANFFRKPRKPYLFINYFNWGDSVIDDTCYVEQAKTLQTNINKRKRHIEQNAAEANGITVIAGQAMSKSNADAMKHAPAGTQVYLDKALSTRGAIEKVYGRALDQGIYQDMMHSEIHIDNIFGAHGTTRGERVGQETASGRAILKESDYGRHQPLAQAIEAFAQEYYGAVTQLACVYYEEDQEVHSDPEDGDADYTADYAEAYINRKEFIGKRVTIQVKEGSTIPKDSMTRSVEAMDLARIGKMSLIDLYETLEYPNPRKLARNAMMETVQPEKLYKQLVDAEAYSIDAIRHIRKLINEQISGEDGEETLETDDRQMLENHVRTHTDYIKGIEVHPDLTLFEELHESIQEQVMKHYEIEVRKLDVMLQDATSQAPALQAIQQAVMQQGAVPAPAMQQPEIPIVL